MARRLFTLAYPCISAADLRIIEAFRADHDGRYSDVVKPHFTMVFGCADVDERDYLMHVEKVARASAPVRFHCRYAMLGSDDEAEIAYVFLVPDEGYSGLSLLHDRLYTGPLKAWLRLELPYIPHMTIGTIDDRRIAKTLCDDLNAQVVSIVGKVDALTVAAMEDGKIKDIAVFRLAG